MKRRILLPVLTLLLLCAGCNGTASAPQNETGAAQPQGAAKPQTAAAPEAASQSPVSGSASFDYYLLTLSWSPEYCHSHPADIQCARHSTFVLHGLWPENNDGTYPENCSNAAGPADPSQYSDIYPDVSLLQHEWKTHGTCSGLAPDAFFQLARKTFQSITVPPELAGLTKQASMPPAQILGLMTKANPSITAEDMALSCGSNYLTAVEVCVDKQGNPMACSKVKTCRANTVRIPPPQ
jgi:ribonuclease T2